MSKKNCYSIHARKENQLDDISFYKDENGMICIHMGVRRNPIYSERSKIDCR